MTLTEAHATGLGLQALTLMENHPGVPYALPDGVTARAWFDSVTHVTRIQYPNGADVATATYSYTDPDFGRFRIVAVVSCQPGHEAVIIREKFFDSAS